MSKHEIASLMCKILGIYLIIQGINVMVNVIPDCIIVSRKKLNLFPLRNVWVQCAGCGTSCEHTNSL